jgi:uncharacterized protein YqcC (DUF446 family)
VAHHPNPINVQIEIIEDAMKKAGVWSSEIPEWLRNYHKNNIIDIWQWLQFIYLPLKRNGSISQPHYVAPMLSPYLNAEEKYRHILQLVIELDAISPAFHKSKM